MPYRKVKSKFFELQKDASEWAKKEKDRAGRAETVKWETNRTDNPEKPWEAVIYKDIA